MTLTYNTKEGIRLAIMDVTQRILLMESRFTNYETAPAYKEAMRVSTLLHDRLVEAIKAETDRPYRVGVNAGGGVTFGHHVYWLSTGWTQLTCLCCRTPIKTEADAYLLADMYLLYNGRPPEPQY
jgi:hypothetical protein